MTTLPQIISWCAVLVGVIIYAATGALWPFIPIGLALFVVRYIAKALEEKPVKTSNK